MSSVWIPEPNYKHGRQPIAVCYWTYCPSSSRSARNSDSTNSRTNMCLRMWDVVLNPSLLLRSPLQGPN